MHSHLAPLRDLTRRALRAALAAARDASPLVAVDATAGNGHDTLFLAESVGEGGRVYAFDTQAEALAATRARLAGSGLLDRVVLVHAGHQTLAETVPPDLHGRIRGATFNLGYLPGGDKGLVTTPRGTLAALVALLPLMAHGGIISVHVYQGHDGGEAEGRAVSDFFAGLPWDVWRVARHAFVNKATNPETLYLAERRA